MSLSKEQIEHLEREMDNAKSWQNPSHSRRYLKKQLHKYIRLRRKQSFAGGKEKTYYKGYEY